ncbi:hypothetical protein [Spirosoma foliorum]|nr:hypothetical protein [Spirosoma foliorum]
MSVTIDGKLANPIEGTLPLPPIKAQIQLIIGGKTIIETLAN